MQTVAEVISKLAEIGGWEAEILDADNVSIKYKTGDKKQQFFVEFLWPLKPDHLVFEIETPVMPLPLDDEQFINQREYMMKVAELALTRNTQLRLMRFCIVEATDGSKSWLHLYIKFTTFLGVDAQSMFEGLENSFKLAIDEGRQFMESIMSDIVGLPSDVAKRLTSS